MSTLLDLERLVKHSIRKIHSLPFEGVLWMLRNKIRILGVRLDTALFICLDSPGI